SVGLANGLAEIVNNMVEGMSIINPSKGDELAGFAKEVELFSRFTEFRKNLNTIREQAKAVLDDPNAKLIDKDMAQKILENSQLYLETELERFNAQRDRAKRESELSGQNNRRAKESSVLKSIGEVQNQMNPFGGGNKFLMEAERLDILSKYAEELEKIKQLEEEGKPPEYIAQLNAQLEQMKNFELDKLAEKYNIFAQAIKEPLNNVFKSLITDFVKGTTSLQDIMLNFLNSVADFFANIASQMLTQKVMGWLGPIFGFSGGGTVGNYKDGGVIEVPNFADGGMIEGIAKAIRKEGSGAIPIVASIGEQILSKRNGDAQFFRSLERSGQWKEMKQSWKFNGSIPNFNSGGPIGGNFMSRPINRTNNNSSVVYNTSINVNAKDAQSFRKSKSQIAQEQRLAQERQNRFT
ncbi:MAG TPA: hypothetical protein VFM18_23155, partial [Methanosarcina sp.]|nr:hypothetical protein [Methanosarcina sp.]